MIKNWIHTMDDDEGAFWDDEADKKEKEKNENPDEADDPLDEDFEDEDW